MQTESEVEELPPRASLCKRALPVALLAGAGVTASTLDLHTYLSIEALQEHRQVLTDFVDSRPLLAAAAFMVVYALVTAVSLPGGAGAGLGVILDSGKQLSATTVSPRGQRKAHPVSDPRRASP